MSSVACAGSGRRSQAEVEGDAARALASRRPAPDSVRAAEYDVTWDDASGELRVQARFTADAGGRFAIEPGVGPFVHQLEAAPGVAGASAGAVAWQAVAAPVGAGHRGEQLLQIPACASGPCQLRYRVALRAAADALDDLSWAGFFADVLVSPPSTWLVAPAPERTPWTLRLAFWVHTPPGQIFVTGAPRARAPVPLTADGASVWELELRDLWTSPYSAFGALQLQTLAIPSSSAGPSSTAGPAAPAVELQLATSAALPEASRDQLASWVTDSAAAVAAYWGRFPMSGALVLLVSTPGARVGGGHTLSGGGGAVVLGVGTGFEAARLRRDWVLVHELVHLGLPSLPRHQLWAEEGLATYVEPMARVRAGLLDERQAWLGLVRGLLNGLLQPNEPGLDGTATWGAIYWGGALFWMLADLRIRERTANRLGLEHALRGIAAAPGGNNASRWQLADVLAVADAAVGVKVLGPLYQEMKDRPLQVDLDQLWRDLGVLVSGDTVTFDDTAPRAALRRAMTHGTPSPPPAQASPVP